MELVRFQHNLAGRHRECAAAIGNFDGVHLGHQAVLRELQRQADAMRLPSVVVTFEPYPPEFLRPHEAPARLTNLRDKLAAIGQLGIDRVVCLRFDQSLAQLSARQFVSELLVSALRVRCLVVGADFRFGRGREGNLELLREWAPVYGYEVVLAAPYVLDGGHVSSSRIRTALTDNRLDAAQRLLGRPFCIRGRVIHGDARGRHLDMPTANMDPKRHRVPLHGIYAVRVHGIGSGPRNGAASVGTRPTFGGQRWVLEVHVLDFDESLYGRHLEVEFVQWLRPERNFDSVQALRAAMFEDVERARAILTDGH